MNQENPELLSAEEAARMRRALKLDNQFADKITRQGDPVSLYESFKLRTRLLEAEWEKQQKELAGFSHPGFTERFEMLPLVDWFVRDESLQGEAGVAYLIRTDQASILFDVGLNQKDSHPSPLLINMQRLGVDFGEIDAIVISHNHSDHVGGSSWKSAASFSASAVQQQLQVKKAITPVAMTYPGLNPVFAPDPLKICEGVITSGLISSPMFLSDTAEQALIICVQHLGVVVISGCGHPGIEKIILRAELLTGQPVFALLGGFHLPLTTGRNITPDYKFTVSGKLPWQSLCQADLEEKANFLKNHKVRHIGISAHDSCDTTINFFKKAFYPNYEDIVVGRKITFQPRASG